jgi:hypothetical protein
MIFFKYFLNEKIHLNCVLRHKKLQKIVLKTSVLIGLIFYNILGMFFSKLYRYMHICLSMQKDFYDCIICILILTINI